MNDVDDREKAWQRVAAEIRGKLSDLDDLRSLGRANAYPVAYFVLIDEVERLRAQIKAPHINTALSTADQEQAAAMLGIPVPKRR